MQTNGESIQHELILTSLDELIYKAMLTDDQVREMRRRYAEGNVSCRDLAREYGMSKCGIKSILRQRTRKRLDP